MFLFYYVCVLSDISNSGVEIDFVVNSSLISNTTYDIAV